MQSSFGNLNTNTEQKSSFTQPQKNAVKGFLAGAILVYAIALLGKLIDEEASLSSEETVDFLTQSAKWLVPTSIGVGLLSGRFSYWSTKKAIQQSITHLPILDADLETQLDRLGRTDPSFKKLSDSLSRLPTIDSKTPNIQGHSGSEVTSSIPNTVEYNKLKNETTGQGFCSKLSSWCSFSWTKQASATPTSPRSTETDELEKASLQGQFLSDNHEDTNISNHLDSAGAIEIRPSTR